MAAPGDTNADDMKIFSINDLNKNMELIPPSEDDGFTLFMSEKKKSVPRMERPQRSINANRNQSKNRVNAPIRLESNRKHSSTLSAGFGKRNWAKPSSEILSSNPSAFPSSSRDGKDNDPLEPATIRPGSISQEILTVSKALPLEENTANSVDESVIRNSGDFTSQCRKLSLAAFMEDYGTYDPDWMKAPIPEQSSQLMDFVRDIDVQNNAQQVVTCKKSLDGCNRLQTHGRAPIHVEFVSFGYHHGIPAEIRHHSTGNSYKQPLPPFDTRLILAPIPPHLAWMDGKSSVIKAAMLRWQATSTKSHSKTEHMNVRDYAEDVLGRIVSNALVDAMVSGDHGFASPITMTIFVGSELGRHRSVVASELGATALRQRLRKNQDNRFQCPVSVGCRHRDIVPHHQNSGITAASKKHKAFEED